MDLLFCDSQTHPIISKIVGTESKFSAKYLKSRETQMRGNKISSKENI